MLYINENYILATGTFNEYLHAIAFIRILGYLYTNGVCYIDNNKNNTTTTNTTTTDKYIIKLFMRHINDVNNMIQDIKLCNTETTITTNENENIPRPGDDLDIEYYNNQLYIIVLPDILTLHLVNLIRLQTKQNNTKTDTDTNINTKHINININKPTELPQFIINDNNTNNDNNCPLPIIREFLAGMFGGDRNNKSLNICNNNYNCYNNGYNNGYNGIAFSYRKYVKYENILTLSHILEQIQLLLTKFNINSVIQIRAHNQNTTHTTKPKLDIQNKNKGKLLNNVRYNLSLDVDLEHLLIFYNTIGFRYSYNKNQRLEVIASYINYNNTVKRQTLMLYNNITKMLNNHNDILGSLNNLNTLEMLNTLDNIINKAVQNINASEPIIDDCIIPSIKNIKSYLLEQQQQQQPSQEHQYNTIQKYADKHIMPFIHYINNEYLGVASWFNHRKLNIHTETMPTMKLQVIGIRKSGFHQVYDIQVDTNKSFIANGIVAHNCLIAHGIMGFMKERMMDVSDKFTIYICKECGLFSIVNPAESGERKCGSCENYTDFMELRIPYACKLLMQELEGMMITPRFNVSKPNL